MYSISLGVKFTFMLTVLISDFLLLIICAIAIAATSVFLTHALVYLLLLKEDRKTHALSLMVLSTNFVIMDLFDKFTSWDHLFLFIASSPISILLLVIFMKLMHFDLFARKNSSDPDTRPQ